MYAIYARQSVDKLDSVSIESQIEFCEYETRGNPYVVYVDRGYSGKNTDRPEFKKMMSDIKGGRIQQIIVYKLDRISRSILDFSKMMESFNKYKVEFISSTEKFDTSTPMGRAMLNICIVFAQLERETIQKRVADAYVSRSKMGFYMGGRIPFGFTKENYLVGNINTSRYVPLESEVSQMKFIFNAYAEPTVSANEIVRQLKELGMKKPNSQWASSKITSLLKNPIYVQADIDIYNFYKSRGTHIVNDVGDFIGTNGCYLYSKDATEENYRKDMMNYENMMLVLAPHEGIIDSETWIKCRLKCEKNKQIPNAKRGHKSWLTSKLKCGLCGFALRCNHCIGKTTERHYFLCSGKSSHGNCNGFGVVRQEDVEQIVFDEMKLKLKNFELRGKEKDVNSLEIGLIKASIINKEKEVADLVSKFGAANDTVIKYLNINIERLDSEIKGQKQQLFALENKNREQQLAPKDTLTLLSHLDNWDNLDMKVKQKVGEILIEKVAVTKEKVDIIWTI